MIFRQLFDQESSTYTFIVGCANTKKCFLIDPVKEHVERDAQFLEELGLEDILILNTHVHADHISGSGLLKKNLAGETAAKSAISRASTGKADILLDDGQILKAGDISLKCIATPGHTAGCMSFYLEKEGIVFTGDALLIRGCGRTDFQGGSAASLYDAIHQKLFTLPPSTLVYPAHDYKGRTCSSIAEESTFNPRLTKSKDEFIKIMDNLVFPILKSLMLPFLQT